MAGKLFIGTSGWVYEHWRGVFYPQELRQSEWFAFYSKHFSTVEINNTFYHLPGPQTFKNWHTQAPEGFTYALKGSRYITHMKKLKDPEEPLKLFLKRALLLKENLGPILFQLPPRWKANPERLERFVKLLPRDKRFVLEFRDRSWFTDEVYDILRNSRTALCIYHMVDYTSPLEVTAPFTYIRFHGTGTLYGGSYPGDVLKEWALCIKKFLKAGLDVYAYFNNDAHGYAVMNAGELLRLLR